MEKLKLFGKKNSGKEELLGIIYVNEKEGTVIDVKNVQVKEDISQEINKELQKYGVIRFVQRGARHIKTAEDLKKYREERIQKFQKILGRDFERYIKGVEEILKLLGKKNITEEENEKFKKKEEKINNQLEKRGLFWGDLVLMVGPWKEVEIRQQIKKEIVEKPSSPFFLPALRGHLASVDKKYGGYILSKHLPITEKD